MAADSPGTSTAPSCIAPMKDSAKPGAAARRSQPPLPPMSDVDIPAVAGALLGQTTLAAARGCSH
jgi:hypothetical protein